MKIRKAVIPAAGLGTRFLPATKTIPKEMLPIVDKPTILYNVEEIIAAGIPELILIAGRDKTSIEDFFDTSYELEELLDLAGKRDLLKPIRDLRNRIKVISIRQQEALGLGHAVLCAEAVVGKEPFAVLLGDEIMITKPGKPSAIAQLVAKIYDKPERPRRGDGSRPIRPKSPNMESSMPTMKSANFWKVNSVVEKPAADKAPSRLALPGRYVFDSEIFNYNREVKPGRNGEIQLTDGMTLLAQRRGMLAMTVDAQRFDAGDKLGFLQANVELALHHPEVGEGFQKLLKDPFWRQNMTFLFALLTAAVSFAYIPEYSLIASRTADQHGRGGYLIEQDVTYRKEGEVLYRQGNLAGEQRELHAGHSRRARRAKGFGARDDDLRWLRRNFSLTPTNPRCAPAGSGMTG